MAWTMHGITEDDTKQQSFKCSDITIYDVFDILWNSTTISAVAMNIMDKNITIKQNELRASICPDKITVLRNKVLHTIEELSLSFTTNGGKELIDLLTSSFANGSTTLEPMLTLIFNKTCIVQGLNIDGSMDLSKQIVNKQRGGKRSVSKQRGGKRSGYKRSAGKRSGYKRSAGKRSGGKRSGGKRSAGKRSGGKRSGYKRTKRLRKGKK